MVVHGRMYIAVCGTCQLMQEGSRVLAAGCTLDTDNTWKMLLEGLRLQEDGRLVAFWETRSENYSWAEMGFERILYEENLERILYQMENLTQHVPLLEIAIGAVVSIGDMDVWHCSSYYSPAGSRTLHADGFANECPAHLESAAVRIAADRMRYELYGEDGWSDKLFFFKDVPFVPGNVKFLYETASEQLYSRPILFKAHDVYSCDPEDRYLQICEALPCDFKDRYLQICETLPPDDAESFFEKTGVKWEDIERYFICHTDPGSWGDWRKVPVYPMEEQEKILKFLRWRYPEEDVYIKGGHYLIGNFIHTPPSDIRGPYQPEEEMRYYPGSWVSMEFNPEVRSVDWGFPEEAKSWIPIPEEVVIPWGPTKDSEDPEDPFSIAEEVESPLSSGDDSFSIPEKVESPLSPNEDPFHILGKPFNPDEDPF